MSLKLFLNTRLKNAVEEEEKLVGLGEKSAEGGVRWRQMIGCGQQPKGKEVLLKREAQVLFVFQSLLAGCHE